MCKHNKEIEVKEPELQAVRTLLEGIGENVEREGLIDTPKRYVKFLKEFTTAKKDFNMTVFENEGNDEMVICKDIPFFSLCEHHLAPFFGVAHIAYLPDSKIVGLSKIPRTLDKFARKPQNQERITTQVAEYLMQELKPKGVAVVIQARHLCVEMRGVEKPGTMTITSAMKGVFSNDAAAKAEFLQFIK
jgi:GTP cyclohydrolase I